jgi:hypothetical protein
LKFSYFDDQICILKLIAQNIDSIFFCKVGARRRGFGAPFLAKCFFLTNKPIIARHRAPVTGLPIRNLRLQSITASIEVSMSDASGAGAEKISRYNYKRVSGIRVD